MSADEVEQIADDARVTVTGFTDPETDEPIEREGVVVSGGHVIDGVPHYDVHLEGESFPSLIEASRVEAAD